MKAVLFISLLLVGCASRNERGERAIMCAKGAVIGFQVLERYGALNKDSVAILKQEIAQKVAERCVESN